MDKSVRHLLIASTFVLLIVGVICDNTEESPGFFLKVSKNVPRLGRRSQSYNDFENFFLKASKTVPRIGRRDDKVRMICAFCVTTLQHRSFRVIVGRFEPPQSIANALAQSSVHTVRPDQ